jgi:hypothetical protein
MKTALKKTLLAALPLAGLLLAAPAAFAHEHHHWHHRWQNGEHCQTDYGRGWQERWRENNNYRPGWYRGAPNYNNDYYSSRYSQPPYYRPWWQSYFYR